MTDIAPYLTGPNLGLRAPKRADAANPLAWLDRQLPLPPAEAEKYLEESATDAWDGGEHVRLVAVQLTSDEIMGSLVLARQNNRIGAISLYTAPNLPGRDQIEAEILTIVLPWALNELDLMVVTTNIAADRPDLAKVAADLGMIEAVRLRESVRRPHGRVDMVTWEIVNPAWQWALDRTEASQ